MTLEKRKILNNSTDSASFINYNGSVHTNVRWGLGFGLPANVFYI